MSWLGDEVEKVEAKSRPKPQDISNAASQALRNTDYYCSFIVEDKVNSQLGGVVMADETNLLALADDPQHLGE